MTSQYCRELAEELRRYGELYPRLREVVDRAVKHLKDAAAQMEAQGQTVDGRSLFRLQVAANSRMQRSAETTSIRGTAPCV